MSLTDLQIAGRSVLVVDDLAMCRETIADLLSSQGCSTHSAANSEECIQVLQRFPVDLLILDVMMPGTDGLELLAQLRRRDRWKSLPVILLTERADATTVTRARQLGVQDYLLKSTFSSTELFSRVSKVLCGPDSARACPKEGDVHPDRRTIDATDTNKPSPPGRDAPRLGRETLLGRIRRSMVMKPMPPVLTRIVAMTSNSSISIHELAGAIRQDQAMAMRVMKFSNSSFYCTGKRAQNLVEATGRLGMAGVRNALMTLASMDHFAKAGSAGLIPQRFWEHSLGSAIIGKALAETFGTGDPEEVFLAALLHDVGRLALADLFPETYRDLLAQVRSSCQSLDQLERETFGLSHIDATRAVLEEMKIPENVVAAACLHDQRARSIKITMPDPGTALTVALADRLVRALAIGDNGCARLSSCQEYIDALRLDRASAVILARSMVDGIVDMETFYACQGGTEFLPPLYVELKGSVPQAPRVAVRASQAPYDEMSIFFGQLGWLVDEHPEVTLSLAEAREDPPAIAHHPGRGVMDAGTNNHPTRKGQHVDAVTELPISYNALIERVTSLSSTCGPM